LILNDVFLVDPASHAGKYTLKKEKREQAPALHAQLSTRTSVAQIKGLSRVILEF
jgi:hypothetical protein